LSEKALVDEHRAALVKLAVVAIPHDVWVVVDLPVAVHAKNGWRGELLYVRRAEENRIAEVRHVQHVRSRRSELGLLELRGCEACLLFLAAEKSFFTMISPT
jgi:hypothetical protein